MRVTNMMMINNMKYNMENTMTKLERLQYQTSQGKKFRLPSDDPIGVSRSLKFYTDISKAEQHLNNAQDAMSWMEATESALKELREVMHRAHELTVQAANGTNHSELDKIQKEIEELRGSVIQISNSTYAGRRLFSGFKTNEDLLRKDGNYNIALTQTEVFEYNVGVAERIEVNTLGFKVFGKPGGTYDGPVAAGDKPYVIELFDRMITNLGNKDQEEIKKDITHIKKAMDNQLTVTAEFGARSNRMRLTIRKVESQVDNMKELLSLNEDVSFSESFTKLMNEENALNASLGVTGRIIQPSLLDFLR